MEREKRGPEEDEERVSPCSHDEKKEGGKGLLSTSPMATRTVGVLGPATRKMVILF